MEAWRGRARQQLFVLTENIVSEELTNWLRKFELTKCHAIPSSSKCTNVTSPNSAGKTLSFARTVDIPRAAYNFRFFATSSLHHTTECSQMDHLGCLNYTIRCPVGVGG